MRPYFYFFVLLLYYNSLFSQNDTNYIYLDRSELICNSDTAFYVKLFYKQGDIWYYEKYATDTRYILEESSFLEDSGKLKQLVEQKFFVDNGVLYKRLIFVRGVLKTGFFYYPDGSIKGTADFNSLGDIVKQSGFDENGGEIRNYYFEKQPELNGGLNYWRVYAYRNLRKRLLHRNGAPYGEYKLRLTFYVNTDGTISDVSVDKDFGFGIKEEALRLLKNTGKWHSGIIDGRKNRMKTSLVLAFRLEEGLLDS